MSLWVWTQGGLGSGEVAVSNGKLPEIFYSTRRLGGERSGGRGEVLRTAGWGLPLSRRLGNSPLSTDLLQTRGRQDLLEALRNAPPTAGFHWQIAESQCATVTQPAGFLSYCKQVFGKENPALLLLHQASPPSFAKKLGYIKI